MYNKQMEMFDDGGLKDQGGTKDNVSGNDVPSGSLKKEVRDDIPAMVSEGEFIFPADVVRYHGLDKLMQMRQEAKMGLSMMEKMGQMGNSEEAELPDDLPFTIADIAIVEDDEELEMAEGGIIFAQEGKYIDPETGYHTGLKLPPSQADQERAAFSDFMGGGDYKDKGPRQYKLKDGSVQTIIHDFEDRPKETPPKGAVLLPLDNGITPLPRPSLPTPSTTPERKEKTAAERQAKADATTARNKKAIKDSATRLGMTVEEYGKLGFGSRLALMGLELKGARGETVTAEERNAAIEKSKEGGAFGGLLGGLGAGLEKFLGKIGFDVDGDGNPFSSSKIKNPETGKWEDPITGKEETEEAPLVRPTVGGKNVAEANIDANLNMRDSDDLGNAPTATTSSSDFISGVNPKNYGMPSQPQVASGIDPKNYGMPSQPDVISKPSSNMDAGETVNRYAKLGTFDDNTMPISASKPIPYGTGRVNMQGQLGQTPTNMYAGIPDGDSPVNTVKDTRANDAALAMQTNNIFGSAQAKTSPIGTDPTFTTPVNPDTVNKQTQNAFDMSSSFNNTAGRSAVVKPLEAASARATSPMGADPTFTQPTRPTIDLNLGLKKEAERIEKEKAEEAKAAKNREDSFSIPSRSGKGLEGSLLSGNDKVKTTSRKTEIDDLQKKAREKRKDKKRRDDAKKGKGAFADRSKRFSKETKGYRGGR